MRIKTKLLLGFTALLVLLVGITSFGYDRLSRMNDKMDSFYDHRFAKVRDVIDLRGAVNSAGRSVSDLLLGTLESDTLSLADMKRQSDTIDSLMKKLSNQSDDPQEQMTIDQANRDIGRYEDFLERFIVLAEAGKRDESLDLYESLGRTRQDNVVSSLNSLVTFEQKSMEQEMNRTRSLYDQSVRWVAVLTVFGLFIGLGIILWVLPSITNGLNLLMMMAKKFGQGRLRGLGKLEIGTRDELGDLARVFQNIAGEMQAKNERESLFNQAKQQQAWLDSQMARTTELLRDDTDLGAVAQAFIDTFAPVLGAAFGGIYLLDAEAPNGRPRLTRYGAYAMADAGEAVMGHPSFQLNEGLVGQCVSGGETMTVDAVPKGYMPIRSGMGEAEPQQLVLQPIKLDAEVIGVIELAYTQPMGNLQRELLERLGEKLAHIVTNIQSRRRVVELLRESQAMTEELQVQSEELISQQEELRVTNEKLEQHTDRLKKSEERLQRQQEELELTNQELTAKTMALEEQNRHSERRNREIAKANAELERQAVQLVLASQYKSEFLANMSHELRTPLNSLIILSQFLADNNEGNLTDKQLQFVSTIHASGNDLLKMIDEILDLAKVDAGKMEIFPEQTTIEDITADLEQVFGAIAADKGIAFSVRLEPEAPAVVRTDGHRLKQILRNLVSNAVKFTSEGSVDLRIRRAGAEETERSRRPADEPYVAFEVEDTGIGIPAEKTEMIFEAFNQADGTTSRRFGGTGLGLTISRELAALLGGWISLRSEPGKGSSFTLYLPERIDGMPDLGRSEVSAAAEEPADGLGDAAVEAYEPETAPGEAALALPALEEPEEAARPASLGGAGEASWVGKKVLLVDDDPRNLYTLSTLLEHHKLQVYAAENGKEALAHLESGRAVDLVLMDIMMPEMDGYEAMARIRNHPDWKGLPIIALTAKAMKGDRDKCLEAGASDYLTKPVMIDQLLSLLKVWLSR